MASQMQSRSLQTLFILFKIPIEIHHAIKYSRDKILLKFFEFKDCILGAIKERKWGAGSLKSA